MPQQGRADDRQKIVHRYVRSLKRWVLFEATLKCRRSLSLVPVPCWIAGNVLPKKMRLGKQSHVRMGVKHAVEETRSRSTHPNDEDGSRQGINGTVRRMDRSCSHERDEANLIREKV